MGSGWKELLELGNENKQDWQNKQQINHYEIYKWKFNNQLNGTLNLTASTSFFSVPIANKFC